MAQLDLNEVTRFVENNIGAFHDKRLARLQTLSLNKVLKRKNPYLFKAKNVLTAQDLIKSILDAHLSSQEETIFGEFLENLAIYISEEVHGGKKSSGEGIDLEFQKGNVTYIVSIKSGPNWGNSSQIKRMVDNFKKAKKILRSNNPVANTIAVNGCCYGKDNKPDKGDYFKYCGQQFWEFISDNPDLYIDIIEPLGHKAKQKNEAFHREYAKIINQFTFEFMQDFCVDGEIQWEQLVQYNSGK